MGRTSAWAGGLAVALVTGVLLATPVPAEPDDWREVSVGPATPESRWSRAITIASDGPHPRVAFEGSEGGDRGLTVATCNLPPCDEASNWRRAVISTGSVANPDLVIDPRSSLNYLAFWEEGWIRYAQCAGPCERVSDWDVVDVVSEGGGRPEGRPPPRLSIALDAAGRPRIAFLDTTLTQDGLVQSVRLASCEHPTCVDEGSWRVATVVEDANPSSSGDVSLAYEGTRPHLSYTRHRSGQGWSELVYLTCDDYCLGSSSWDGLVLGGSVASISAASHEGTMGVVFHAPGDGTGRQVDYRQCSGACLDLGSWSSPVRISSDAKGKGPDLVFTDRGSPRVAVPGGQVAACEGGAVCATPTGWTTDLVAPGATWIALANYGDWLRAGYIDEARDGPRVGASTCDDPCGEPPGPRDHPGPVPPSTSRYPPGEDPRDRRVEQFQTGAGSTSTSSPSTSTTATSQPPDGEGGFRWSVRRSPRPPASAEALTPGDPEFWLRGPGRKVVPADDGAAQGLPGRGDDQTSAPIIETDGATVAAAILALILAGVGVGVRLWVIQPLVRGRREPSARR